MQQAEQDSLPDPDYSLLVFHGADIESYVARATAVRALKPLHREALAAAAQSGDRDAAQRLLYSYLPKIVRAVYAEVSLAPEATFADTLQETLGHVWSVIVNQHGEPGDVHQRIMRTISRSTEHAVLAEGTASGLDEREAAENRRLRRTALKLSDRDGRLPHDAVVAAIANVTYPRALPLLHGALGIQSFSDSPDAQQVAPDPAERVVQQRVVALACRLVSRRQQAWRHPQAFEAFLEVVVGGAKPGEVAESIGVRSSTVSGWVSEINHYLRLVLSQHNAQTAVVGSAVIPLPELSGTTPARVVPPVRVPLSAAQLRFRAAAVAHRSPGPPAGLRH